MDLRERQRPLEDGYGERPDDARISLSARGSEAGEAVACSVDVGRAVQAAEAHGGVGGPGRARARATCSSGPWRPAPRSPARWSRRPRA